MLCKRLISSLLVVTLLNGAAFPCYAYADDAVPGTEVEDSERLPEDSEREDGDRPLVSGPVDNGLLSAGGDAGQAEPEDGGEERQVNSEGSKADGAREGQEEAGVSGEAGSSPGSGSGGGAAPDVLEQASYSLADSLGDSSDAACSPERYDGSISAGDSCSLDSDTRGIEKTLGDFHGLLGLPFLGDCFFGQSDLSSGDSGSSSLNGSHGGGDSDIDNVGDHEEVEPDDGIVPLALPAIVAWLGTSGVASSIVDGIFSTINSPKTIQDKILVVVNAIGHMLTASYNKLSDIQSNTYRSQLSLSSSGVVGSALINLDDNVQAAWGYGYGGTAVFKKNSPAGWLNSINNSTDGLVSLLEKQWGYGYGGTAVIKSGSPASYLSKIYNNSFGEHTFDGNLVEFDAPEALWQIWRYQKSTKLNLDTANQYLGHINNNAADTSARVNLLRSEISNLLSTTNQLLTHINNNAADTSARVNILRSGVQKLIDQNEVSSSFFSKAFSDLLLKLDHLSFTVVPDMSGVESRLDRVIDLLLLAGAKDVLDDLLGDFNLVKANAMAASVQTAISNAFPFCIPAVLKQVLGLVQAEAVPPSFSFDFFGAPLEFDFEDWRGLADVTGWICRLFFTVGLLSQTRRFIFAGRDGVA